MSSFGTGRQVGLFGGLGPFQPLPRLLGPGVEQLVRLAGGDLPVETALAEVALGLGLPAAQELGHLGAVVGVLGDDLVVADVLGEEGLVEECLILGQGLALVDQAVYLHVHQVHQLALQLPQAPQVLALHPRLLQLR